MLVAGNIAAQIPTPAVENKGIELKTLTHGILRVFHQPRDLPSGEKSRTLRYESCGAESANSPPNGRGGYRRRQFHPPCMRS